MTKCFYHSADLDGKCSAAIVLHQEPDTELFPINYDGVDKFPWDKIGQGDTVYMVDFSLPNEMMARLKAACLRLIWIDHHKTAIDSVTGEYQGRREVGKAGCELVWEYFHNPEVDPQPTPKVVTLLGRYDVWDKNHPEWRAMLQLQSGMRLHDMDPRSSILWPIVFRDDSAVEKLVKEGETALRCREAADAAYVKQLAFPVTFDGLRGIACNRAQMSSQSFESVYDPAKHDVMIAFAYNGSKWIVSLYSDKAEVDCGEACKRHGGGGHKGAAGFNDCCFPRFGEQPENTYMTQPK